MVTAKKINEAARRYSDVESLQEAFKNGARFALTGKLCKEGELFEGDKPQVQVLGGGEVSFELWWDMYRKKRGRKKAKQKWDRLTKQQQEACLRATPAYVESTPDVTYRKDPLTYLNGECWEDEIINNPNYEQQRAQRLSDRTTRLLSQAFKR